MNEYQPRPEDRALRGPGQTALVDPRSAGLVPFRAAPPAEGAIAEIDPHEIWRVLTKWRWLIAGCTVLALLVGLAFSLLATPMYKSAAQVEIALAQEDITSNNDRGNRQTAVRDPQYLATQIGLLKSRSLAERVIADLGLDGKSG
ncbi:MAG: Wzz/FepE/Etk N-terminal domain-containing protein, partial [Pseudomonadota bacterium]